MNVDAMRFAAGTSPSCSSVKIARQTTPLCSWGSGLNSLACATEHICPAKAKTSPSSNTHLCRVIGRMVLVYTNWIPVQPHVAVQDLSELWLSGQACSSIRTRYSLGVWQSSAVCGRT